MECRVATKNYKINKDSTNFITLYQFTISILGSFFEIQKSIIMKQSRGLLAVHFRSYQGIVDFMDNNLVRMTKVGDLKIGIPAESPTK